MKAFKYSHITGVKIIIEYGDNDVAKSSLETIRESSTISTKKVMKSQQEFNPAGIYTHILIEYIFFFLILL